MAKRKTVSRSALARELIEAGKLTANAIAKRTGLSPQTIYTLKWKMANKKGLGAIKPQTPPVGKGTGIASSVPRAKIPLEFEIIDRPKKKSNNRRQGQLKRWERERHLKEIAKLDNIYGRTVLVPATPTLWQRIKAFVFGA
jgi:hypothetical protein